MGGGSAASQHASLITWPGGLPSEEGSAFCGCQNQGRPPPPVPGYSQLAVGKHPTGMQSCLWRTSVHFLMITGTHPFLKSLSPIHYNECGQFKHEFLTWSKQVSLVDVSKSTLAINRTCWEVVHGDCYVTIIVFLHTTPAYPNPCYVMITVDRGSTSMILAATRARNSSSNWGVEDRLPRQRYWSRSGYMPRYRSAWTHFHIYVFTIVTGCSRRSSLDSISVHVIFFAPASSAAHGVHFSFTLSPSFTDTCAKNCNMHMYWQISVNKNAY